MSGGGNGGDGGGHNTSSLSRKQYLQQLGAKRKKIRKKLQKSSSDPLTNEMIDEMLTRSCIDRLQSFLPQIKKKCPKPPSPFNSPKSFLDDIPYIGTKTPIPWISSQSSSTPTPLSEELAMFADYVSVSALVISSS